MSTSTTGAFKVESKCMSLSPNWLQTAIRKKRVKEATATAAKTQTTLARCKFHVAMLPGFKAAQGQGNHGLMVYKPSLCVEL